MMDYNSIEDGSLDKHPAIQKRIGEYYIQNVKNIRKTMMIVLSRKLDAQENEKLRKYCFDLAVAQVASEFRDNIGIPEEDLKEMYQSLSEVELLQFFNDGLTEIQEDKE